MARGSGDSSPLFRLGVVNFQGITATQTPRRVAVAPPEARRMVLSPQELVENGVPLCATILVLLMVHHFIGDLCSCHTRGGLLAVLS
jgi:hypothetical protein